MPNIKHKLQPSYELTEWEQEQWDLILDNHPANFFEIYQAPLLTEYVKSLSLAKHFGRMIFDPTLALSEHVEKDTSSYFTRRNQATNNASSLATRLRLTPQSVLEDRSVSVKKAQTAASAPRPWESND